MADPLAREQLKLYGLPQAEFTAARNARAKELRKDDPELAATCRRSAEGDRRCGCTQRAGSRGSVRGPGTSSSRESGCAEAQEAAVAGKPGADLPKAIEEHRSALDRMQRDLRRRKLSGATLDKAVKTLRVASIDPELQPLLERGTLHEDLAAAGSRSRPGNRPGGAKARIRPTRSAGCRAGEATAGRPANACRRPGQR